jgi:hypothetical protein
MHQEAPVLLQKRKSGWILALLAPRFCHAFQIHHLRRVRIDHVC